MSVVKKHAATNLFGAKPQINVGRGVAEFHARRPVLIADGVDTLLALPVEGLDERRLAEFAALCAPAVPRLVVTARRALALGLDATTPMVVQLGADLDAAKVLALVADVKIDCAVDAKPAGPAAVAAIQLVKLSQGLPAVLVADAVVADARLSEQQVIRVDADAVVQFGEGVIRSLALASRAAVPLDSGSRAEFVVFRDAMGGSSTAIHCGQARLLETRIWSACTRPVSPAMCSAHDDAIAAISSNSRSGVLKGSAGASSFIWHRRAAGLASPTKCGPIRCRTMGSIRSMPT